jgi:hypothetical protein
MIMRVHQQKSTHVGPACPAATFQKEALSVRLAWTGPGSGASSAQRADVVITLAYIAFVVGKDRPLLSINPSSVVTPCMYVYVLA